MEDPTEDIRRQMVESGQPYKELLGTPEHMTWTTEQLKIDFEMLGFAAPFVIVRRTADGVKGTMMFTHWPRYYFDFQPDKQKEP